ncbi:MAG: magnesium/cobalt transporter CorA [Putridiphycobacter sp.]
MKNKKWHIGGSPDEILYTGSLKSDRISVELFDYNETKLVEKQVENYEEFEGLLDSDSVSWVNIVGLSDLEALMMISKIFNIESLILSDILDVRERPKVEEYKNFLFSSVNSVYFTDHKNEKFQNERFSLLIYNSVVISFQEFKMDVFDPVRKRIRDNKRRIRTSGTDYLAYCLLDIIVDNYIHILNETGNKVEDLEEEVLNVENKEVLLQIKHLKKEINEIRKNLHPTKEMILLLSKLESPFILKKNRVHFKDLLNNVNQAVEISSSYRDQLSDQLNIFHTIMSSQLNDVMKFLTIFSVIFIPLTFIAGIYGTNFDYIPELKMKWGYFIMLIIMVIIAVLMLLFFKRKKWF